MKRECGKKNLVCKKKNKNKNQQTNNEFNFLLLRVWGSVSMAESSMRKSQEKD